MRLIDADAFRASICESCLKHGGVCYARPDFDGYECSRVMPIDRAPTIDAEPVRHGTWVLVKEWATKAKYRCSICGREEMSKAGGANLEKLPYCHCGAKMEGE